MAAKEYMEKYVLKLRINASQPVLPSVGRPSLFTIHSLAHRRNTNADGLHGFRTDQVLIPGGDVFQAEKHLALHGSGGCGREISVP